MTDAAGEGVRLQKVLARAGFGSRRTCDDLIAAGRVRVDGAVAVLGRRVDAETALILVDGAPVGVRPGLVYYLLNKPVGVVTTADDPQGRPVVVGLVPDEPRVFPVGRLDLDTEGLLLLTNDGEIANRITHPSYGVEKEYVAHVEGSPTRSVLRQLREGVELDDGVTAPARVTPSSRTSSVWSSTRAATARCGACATPSGTPSSDSSEPGSGPWPTARSDPAPGGTARPTSCGHSSGRWPTAPEPRPGNRRAAEGGGR